MGVCFSSTDNNTISEWPGHWLVALVINKRGQTVAQLHTWTPIHLVAELEVTDVLTHPNKDELIQEVKTKVREPKSVSPVPLGGQLEWMGHYHQYDYSPTPYKKPEPEKPKVSEDLNLLEQLYPEIAGKCLIDLTQEEWGTLDTILETLNEAEQKEIFAALDENEDDWHEDIRQYELEYLGIDTQSIRHQGWS
jgi:hypothetical protein